MLIHLVRKDFLIVKKYVLLMLAVCVFIPPFMMWRIDDATYVGSMSFILAAIFSVFILKYLLRSHSHLDKNSKNSVSYCSF